MSHAEGGESKPGTAYQFTVIREKMHRHPGPVLDFALGRRRQTPPKWLEAFVREHAQLVLRRRQEDELEAFVDAAAGMLEAVYGVRVAARQILPSPSGRAAMSALAATLIAPGDRVLVTEPGYPAFARIAAQAHARLTVAPLDPTTGFAPDLEGLSEGAAPRLVALNYPNNPTGAVLAEDAFEEIRRRVGAATVLYNDAIYGPLTYHRGPWSLLADEFAGDLATVIELHSLGKLFALGPLGSAFLVGPEESIHAIRRFSDFSWTQLSSLQVRVATRCLDDWQHVGTVRDGLADRLERLRGAVTAVGFEPYPTDAGMYLLCRAPAAVGDRRVGSAAEVAEILLEEYGLAVAPWDVGEHSYIRFSAQYRDQDLAALSELGSGLKLVSS
jgi:aspartate/methionine/tyrosine aminotransferase